MLFGNCINNRHCAFNMAKTSFVNVIPLVDDASVVADIHLRAMDQNLLTHAQFPNPKALEYFHSWIARDTLQHISDSDKGVLIARHPHSEETVGFLKWSEYGPGGEPAAIADEWPEYCGRQILDEYSALAAEARKSITEQHRNGYFRKLVSCRFVGIQFLSRSSCTSLLLLAAFHPWLLFSRFRILFGLMSHNASGVLR